MSGSRVLAHRLLTSGLLEDPLEQNANNRPLPVETDCFFWGGGFVILHTLDKLAHLATQAYVSKIKLWRVQD